MDAGPPGMLAVFKRTPPKSDIDNPLARRVVRGQPALVEHVSENRVIEVRFVAREEDDGMLLAEGGDPFHGVLVEDDLFVISA